MSRYTCANVLRGCLPCYIVNGIPNSCGWTRNSWNYLLFTCVHRKCVNNTYRIVVAVSLVPVTNQSPAHLLFHVTYFKVYIKKKSCKLKYPSVPSVIDPVLRSSEILLPVFIEKQHFVIEIQFIRTLTTMTQMICDFVKYQNAMHMIFPADIVCLYFTFWVMLNVSMDCCFELGVTLETHIFVTCDSLT